MSPELLDDYRWLIGDDARRWLRRVAEDPLPLVRQAAALRREISAKRTHLVLEQAELRRRARVKFSEADRMFFTPVGLEQATDEVLASYKADRFPLAAPLADLCCGIGGDLLALARRGPVSGVDRDPVVTLLAEANLDVLCLRTSGFQPRILLADAAAISLEDYAAWHVDPDRRPQGRRTTQVELHEPAASILNRLLHSDPHAAMKLAPATDPPRQWALQAELEWISRGGECRQLVAWFGSLARQPGYRRATVLSASGRAGLRTPWTIFGQPSESLPVAPRIGRYLFDPDPAVLAARLLPVLAERHTLAAVDTQSVYLTGDEPVATEGVACFEVTDVLPFDRRRLNQVFDSRGIGQLEIKKRGVGDTPEQIRRRLRLRGDKAAVLLLTPIGGRVAAVLARRLDRPGSLDFCPVAWYTAAVEWNPSTARYNMSHDWTRRDFLATAGAAAATGALAAGAKAADPQTGKIKIVGIACSLREGKSTVAAVKACLDAAQAVDADAIETELIDLATMSIPAEPAAGIPLKPGHADDFPTLVPKLADPAVRGIIVGTPVYFSNMSSLCKAFLERCMTFRKDDFRLSNKVAGVLAIGGARDGGQELAIRSVQIALNSQNMIVVGEAKPSCHAGAAVWNTGDDFLADEQNQKTINCQGQRVAEVALLLAGKRP